MVDQSPEMIVPFEPDDAVYERNGEDRAKDRNQNWDRLQRPIDEQNVEYDVTVGAVSIRRVWEHFTT